MSAETYPETMPPSVFGEAGCAPISGFRALLGMPHLVTCSYVETEQAELMSTLEGQQLLMQERMIEKDTSKRTLSSRPCGLRLGLDTTEVIGNESGVIVQECTFAKTCPRLKEIEV